MFEKNFIHHIPNMPHKIFLTFLELYSKTALKGNGGFINK